MKENSKKVFDFVKAHDGEDFTAQDIADATGLSVRSVNGIVTSAFQRYKDEDIVCNHTSVSIAIRSTVLCWPTLAE